MYIYIYTYVHIWPCRRAVYICVYSYRNTCIYIKMRMYAYAWLTSFNDVDWHSLNHTQKNRRVLQAFACSLRMSVHCQLQDRIMINFSRKPLPKVTVFTHMHTHPCTCTHKQTHTRTYTSLKPKKTHTRVYMKSLQKLVCAYKRLPT